jgi:hypothetical protein
MLQIYVVIGGRNVMRLPARGYKTDSGHRHCHLSTLLLLLLLLLLKEMVL